MISAGVDDLAIDKISYFLTAVTGFSPLIFDLPSEAELGELLAACRKVWKNIENDHTIIEKWVRFSIAICHF